MSFLLYDVEKATQQYTLAQEDVNIAGALAAIVKTRNTTGESPYKWEATAADIVAALHGMAGQEIVIDLKPNISQNVSLYRLVCVWGFSSAYWTPLALLLETLFSDRKEQDAQGFKKQFKATEADKSLVGEFLYIQGGVKGGKWNWGKVGSVNGALLWSDAFTYLTGKLGEKLQMR
jgi:hypothetical protein